MSRNDAFAQGYIAYWNGIESDGNPHPHGEPRGSWDQGWCDAQLEDDEGWLLVNAPGGPVSRRGEPDAAPEARSKA